MGERKREADETLFLVHHAEASCHSLCPPSPRDANAILAALCQ